MSIVLKKHQLVFLLMLIMLLFTLFQPNFAFAQAGDLDNSPVSRGLCNVLELVSGNIGKALAIFAIVMVGFGFFTGKFSIALVIGITLGIGILFGAPKIIAALTGEQTVDCKSVTPGEDVACPSDTTIVSEGFPLSKASYNSITKSFTIKSESDDLAKISCYNYGSGEIRVHFTPLVSSINDRTADTGIFTSAGGFGTLPTTPVRIPRSGNLPLTASRATVDPATALTFKASAFCPHVEPTITFDNTGTCSSGGKIIAYAAAAVSGSSSPTVLCVPNGVVKTSSITSSNITHSGPLTDKNAGGKFIIKAGFFGDTRRHNLIGVRDIIVTCGAGGLWDISTTGNAAADCTASNTCMGASISALNFNFQDR